MIDEAWWPEPLAEFAAEDPSHGDHLVAAEIAEPWNTGSCKRVFTALVHPELEDELLKREGGIGYEVTANGPHPTPPKGVYYEPRFSIWAGEIQLDGLEPLVVSWEQYNHTTLLPDQGFLMTYGLTPRATRDGEADELHWDDLSQRKRPA